MIDLMKIVVYDVYYTEQLVRYKIYYTVVHL